LLPSADALVAAPFAQLRRRKAAAVRAQARPG
jgi:hypothetical protein